MTISSVVSLMSMALSTLLVGCYTPPSQGQADAVSAVDSSRNNDGDGDGDGRLVDAAPGDAAAGLQSLARAPKTCDVSIADPVVVQAAPSWNGDISASSLQGLSRIFYQCNEVWAVSARFSIQSRPMGTEPSIVLRRADVINAPTFVMAYTVESIVQQGESSVAFAGGFILSANTSQFSVATIQRDPATGISSLVIATDAGTTTTLDLGNPTPPYRLHWRLVRTGDQLANIITLYTATTTHQFPPQLMPLPSTDLILQIGVNRYKGGQATKMTISDLELP